MALGIQRISLFTTLALSFAASSSYAALTHRYSFTDGGKDSVGQVDAKTQGEAKIADGKLTLKNEDKSSGDAAVSFLEFAGPLLPKTGSGSIAIWFSASEVGSFSRLLDIGDTEGGEGRAFIYIIPRNGEDNSRVAITATDAASKTAQDNSRLDDGKPHMIAVSIDGTPKKLQVFIDGKLAKPADDLGENTLDKVRQKHSWIGRSGFDNDPGLTGSIDEVRVYDHALTADEAAASFTAGPDKLPDAAAGTAPPAKANN